MYQKTAVVVLIAFVIFAFVIIANKGAVKNDSVTPVINPVTEEQSLDEVDEVEGGSGMPAQKIDVRVACESALMYTTFTDGVAADAFVAECIEGKHPEVIERYINDLQVDGAVI